MKTRIILDSGTEIIIFHSIQELMDLQPNSKGFVVVNVSENGSVFIKPDSIIYMEDAT